MLFFVLLFRADLCRFLDYNFLMFVLFLFVDPLSNRSGISFLELSSSQFSSRNALFFFWSSFSPLFGFKAFLSVWLPRKK